MKDAVDGERVEKLVGEEAARRNASGNFDGWAALPFLDEAREASRKLVAAGRRALDSDVAKSVVKLRKLGLRKFEDVAGEPAHASASFDKKKFGGTIKLLPHFGELASQQAAKDGMDIDTGVVVGETLRFTTTVITVHRVVETLAHVFGEGDGSKTTDALSEKRSERGHAETAPEARSFCSCCQMSWKTSQAAESKRTK